MKKIFIAIVTVLALLPFTACSDILDVDSDTQVFEPELNQKTDSVFFAFGIMQAMQQLADQYVFQGEMRGDNVAMTKYTNNNLRQLANFSATAANKYDSAYVYYKVINNCNYYIAYRDTTLMTGSTNVVMNEYAAVKAFRAWAYLQLARNYGKVPFFTEPLTTISQINGSSFPELSLTEIVAQLAPDLAQYSGMALPNDGAGTVAAGSTNSGTAKTFVRGLCFIPVDVILGEMYLEAGDYANAAKYYTIYMTQTPHANNNSSNLARPFTSQFNGFSDDKPRPSDYTSASGISWSSIFSNNSTNDIITYIPMAVNYQLGATTELPITFGYDYYSTEGRNNLYKDEIQLTASSQLKTLSDTATYYYYRNGTVIGPEVNCMKYGDARLASVTHETHSGDSTLQYITKYNNGNIILFRATTVYLHLAEALNRLGYPDAAFAILKDGINKSIIDPTYTYLSSNAKKLFTTTYPFLGNQYSETFPAHTPGDYSISTNYGIHGHGAGVTQDDSWPNRPGSPMSYNYWTEVGNKLGYMRQVAQQQGWGNVGTTKQDSIEAMENLLCDEYQLEFAFEGTRWYDLMRLARHKNQAATYGSNWGNKWLSWKLRNKGVTKDLADENNWYLPIK